MDHLIARFDAVRDADLMLCEHRGVAYQKDMSTPITYDDRYFRHYVDLEHGEIASKLNEGRRALVDKHVCDSDVVDIGIGSGAFIKTRPNTFGHDVNKTAITWLKQNKRLAGPLKDYQAFTFWDVIEHVPEPDGYFRQLPDHCFLFTCLPVFDDLKRIRESKHYKPNEHLYYWTEQGFVDWMALYRFRLLERQVFETEAGRDHIISFAFKRDLPGRRETVAQYQILHAPAYGTSAYLYFDQIAKVVIDLNPSSILDFGCGRGDLVAHFWKDGARRIAKYDPAIPQWKEMPDGRFDLVLATDVMEHINMADVERIFNEIKGKSGRALFTISMKPARAKLPDGRNAHVTLLTASEWLRWIKATFGAANRIQLPWGHLLMVRTF